MKKLFTILFMVIPLVIAMTSEAQVLIAKWTFPTGNPSDSLADGGLAANLSRAIRTEGGTSTIDFSKNGLTTKSAQATGWDNGAMAKSWIIGITTLNHDHLKISSKQQSGGNNPGPRDYLIQYRVAENGMWTDVPNTVIVTANNWTSGVVDSIPLPDTCANKPSLFLRWLMTTNASSTGGTVVSTGIDKIDDIFITGKQVLSAVNETATQVECRIFPNPAHGELTINAPEQVVDIYLVDPEGKCVKMQFEPDAAKYTVPMNNLPSGTYMIKIRMKSGKVVLNKIILH